mgnify:CR=1 FL=1
MKTKSPASGKRTGLDDDSQKIDSSTNFHKLTTSLNGNKTLKPIARKWAFRGYYPSPSKAMKALLQGGGPWN